MGASGSGLGGRAERRTVHPQVAGRRRTADGDIRGATRRDKAKREERRAGGEDAVGGERVCSWSFALRDTWHSTGGA